MEDDPSPTFDQKDRTSTFEFASEPLFFPAFAGTGSIWLGLLATTSFVQISPNTRVTGDPVDETWVGEVDMRWRLIQSFFGTQRESFSEAASETMI